MTIIRNSNQIFCAISIRRLFDETVIFFYHKLRAFSQTNIATFQVNR